MSAAIQLASFPNLSPEDTISPEITRLAKGEDVELVLETGADVVWWKGIEAKSASGAPLALIQTTPPDVHGPNVATIAAASLAGSRLVLSKAKHDVQFAGRVDRTSLAIEAIAYVRAALPSRPSAGL